MSDAATKVCPVCGLSYHAPDGDGPCPRCALTSALFAPPVPVATGLLPGGRLAHFDLIDELGRGAMGRVWLARDTQLDRLVALKTLPAAPDPQLQRRLEREARTAAALHHPHIITVHGLGQEGGSIWLAMEFAEGGDLRAHLRDRPLPVKAAAAYAEKLARALVVAHAAGVLHRDLKPSNILLTAAGEPMLADFGLAAPQNGGDLTLTGQVLGTPSYLAPELLRPESERSAAQAHLADIYSLGAVLYEMLAGRPPFVGDTTAAILSAVATQEPVAPGRIRADLPRDLETIVLKCLEREPARRYATAADLAADLAAFLAGRPIAARPVSGAGRLWRWARREPRLAIALSTVALLLVTVATVATLAAVNIARAEKHADAEAVHARAEAAHATRAEAATRDQLRAALLAEAQATRQSGKIGQRFDTLEILGRAAAIRTGPDLQEEAILALTLPDLHRTRPDRVVRDTRTQALAFDQERRRLAVETKDGNWDVQDLDSSQPLLHLTSRAGRSLTRPVFSADGRYFVTRTAAANVVVWDLTAPGEPRLVLPGRRYALLRSELRDYGAPDAISPDSHLLFSADDETGFTVYELPSGKELSRIATPGRVTHLVFSPDGRQIAVGHGLRARNGVNDHFLALAPVEEPARMRAIASGDTFQSFDWSADSSRLIFGSSTWDVRDSATDQTLVTLRDDASSGLLLPDGRSALTIAKNGSIRYWDLKSGDSLLRGHLQGGIELGVSADRRRISCESGDTEMADFALELPTVETTFPSPTKTWDNASRFGSTLAYSPDGRWLVECVWGMIYLRDGATARVLDSREFGTSNDFTSALFTPDGHALLVGTGATGVLRLPLVEEAGGTAKMGPEEIIDPDRGGLVSDLSPDGRKLLLVQHERLARVKVLTLDGSAAPVSWPFAQPTRGMFTRDGQSVVVNGYSELGKLPVDLYDASTGKKVRSLGMTQGYELSWSRDRNWVVIGTNLKTSGLWRTDTWQPGPTLFADAQGAGKATAFSPDGTLLAVAGGGDVYLIRVADGEQLVDLTMDRTDNFAPDITFSPDGKQLAVLWHLGQLTLWNLPALHRELGQLGLDWK